MSESARVLPDSRRQRRESGNTPGTNARSRFYRLRAFFLCTSVLVLFPALAVESDAGSENCDSLPDDRRSTCLMVQACATLPTEQDRQECYGAVADRVTESEKEPVAEVARPVPVEQTTVAEAPRERPAAPPAESEPADNQTTADASEDRKRTGTLDTVRRLFSRSSAPAGPEIPRRFTALVTAHRDLARDRQLVVLDDKLLFEGDKAASSAIKVGDQVDVVKSSSLRGRKYQISGPSKRRFEALRIRCERTDLNVENRRKCHGMMGGAER